MAEYKEIKGIKIQEVTSDPPNSVEGQLWYNSTTDQFKFDSGPEFDAWETSSPFTAGDSDFGSGGTETSAIKGGGRWFYGTVNFPPFTGTIPEARTESFDGTTWTQLNAPTTDHRTDIRGNGTGNTNAIIFGGYTPNEPGPGLNIQSYTESWNGTSWTGIPHIPTGSALGVGVGSNTNALNVGGTRPGPPYSPVVTTAIFNGSSWTNQPNIPFGTNNAGMAGTTTSALYTGGENGGYFETTPPPVFNNGSIQKMMQEWDGSSWTFVGNMPTFAKRHGHSGSATQSLVYGGEGDPPSQYDSNRTIFYNGTSWTTKSNMISGAPSSDLNGVGTAGTGALAPMNSATQTQKWTSIGAGGKLKL
jgi:hypothetical protein